jgi:hypothetical protein
MSGFVGAERVYLALSSAGLLAAVLGHSSDAFAFSNAIGFGAALYTDSAERTNESEPSIGNAEELDGTVDMETDSSLALNLWYLRSPTPAGSVRFMFGGGVGFYNDFSVYEVPEEDNNEEPEIETYGNLFQFYLQGDLAIPLTGTGKFELLLGGRMGPMLLFQARDLQKQLDELSKQGVSVWPDAPRVGAFIGPHVGVLWSFAERVGLRFDTGVQFNYLPLYSGESEFLDGATIERSATYTSTRYHGLLGLQVGF